MDKSSASKGHKKKGNKLVRRLLKWGGSKNKPDQSALRSKDVISDDEEQWQRIKNMEQTRTISAMKSHIQKLEEKLGNLQNKGDIDAYTTSNSEDVTGPDGSAVGHIESDSTNYQKMKEQNEGNIQVMNVESHRLGESSYVDVGDAAEMVGDLHAYEEKDEVLLKRDVCREQCSMTENTSEANAEENRFNTEADEENDSEIEVRLDSGLASDIIDEITNDDIQVCASPKEVCETLDDHFFKQNDTLSCRIQDHNDVNHDYSLQGSAETHLQSDAHESQSTSMKPFADFTNPSNLSMESDSISREDNYEVSVIQADGTENYVTSNVPGDVCDLTIETGDETNTNEIELRNSSCILEETGSVSFVDRSKLEEINMELKERVSVLEEQLWLAAEERRNIQAVLELQKEKALKNLAFKFEEINRKTLREFKGIFEYRLQELNEEKVKLQEQLQSHKCPEGMNECSGEGSEVLLSLKERLAESEKKYAKLIGENHMLKRRCRKLSGDLGTAKKAVGSLAVGNDNVGVDASAQTGAYDFKKGEVGIQCKLSPGTSLNDLHNDVKDIATKISIISSCLVGEQGKMSQDESFTDNDILNSVSSTNESGIESLQVSPVNHEENDIMDYNALSYWGSSKENDQVAIPEFFGEKENQFSHPIDESDSVLYENDSVQLSMDDIEKPLLRIHAKYMKISEELEHIATGRFTKYNTNIVSGKGTADISMLQLDPEIKRIIDEVNRKYDDYFNTNKNGLPCE